VRRALAAAAALAALAGPARAAAPLPVVATIQPLGYLVREVGGARTSVSVLVPPGASPHTFEPQPSDVESLAGARLLVEVGGIDRWARALLSAASAQPERLTLLELPGLDPLPADPAEAREAGSRQDPHVWLDPIRVRDVVVPAIAAKLAALDPAGRAAYETERDRFAAELTALDTEVRSTLAPHGRRFVAFHSAWRYFAQRYGLEQIGVVEEAPGEEPGPQQLARLVERARAAQLPAILVEPQLSPRVAQVLAAEFGATTVLSDPEGDPTDPARNGYAKMMRWNAAAFAKALGPAR